LITEKHTFNGVENYFTDFLLYQDPLKLVEDPTPEDNEADTKPEPEEECL